MNSRQEFSLEITEVAPTKLVAAVTPAPSLVQLLYSHMLARYQTTARAPGFTQGALPADYIARNYHSSITTQLQQFLLRCYAEPFLLHALRKRGVLSIGQPYLTATRMTAPQTITFLFECTPLPCQVSNQWRHTNFRAPPRKNYRDLDNQVHAFRTDEALLAADIPGTIIADDWIGFDLLPSAFAAEAHQKAMAARFWLKIGSEDPDQEARQLFVDKRPQSQITTQAQFLQDYFCASQEAQYTFDLTIAHHIPYTAFCFDAFKHHFKLRSDKDVHRKLIEVFSYRNDISQRRETAEAVLKLILKQHPFQVPADLVHEERMRILSHIAQSPDYYVHKAQPDFDEKVELLAQKQLKEVALIDAIAHAERIEVNEHDIASYLNLLKRPRTKEFVYFRLPETRHHEREIPIAHELLYQTCLREKTLNTIIHILTRSST